MTKKLTTDEFIERAKRIHGDKYDYSKVNYVNSFTKVCIICPEHGEFMQIPSAHLFGKGCKKCANEKLYNEKHKNNEQFIKDSKKIHGNKYDYSKVEYKGSHEKVCIICPEHGEFMQTPTNHLCGKGCKKCALENSSKKRMKDFKQFIKDAKQVHGDKYDYSNAEYKGCEIKICIICPEHGEFWQTPSNHLKGKGCKKCGKEIQQIPNLERCEKAKNEFIEKAKKIHDNKYDYSKVEYVNSHKKVCIICPEHGEFWQTPTNHLCGKGCSSCNESRLEKYVRCTLIDNNIKYESKKHFDWLGKQHLDFYLPDYNIAIECQGLQHFEPVDFAGKGEEWAKQKFIENIKRDERKKKLCEENNIKLIYYVGKNKNNILKEIKNEII